MFGGLGISEIIIVIIAFGIIVAPVIIIFIYALSLVKTIKKLEKDVNELKVKLKDRS